MINFKNDENLGQVIEKTQLFSFGAAPIQDLKELVFAAGGNKFSSLCGFKFISKADIEYKEFLIAFVCKLRSKIYRRQTTNPSQWFIFKKISGSEMHCLDAESLLVQYGFDIKKFFDSDLFKRSVKRFEQAVKQGLTKYVPEYVKQHGAEKAKDVLTSYDGHSSSLVKDAVTRYVNAIEEGSKSISSTVFNNKFYKLINFDTAISEDDIEESRYHSPGASGFDMRYQHKGGTLTVNGLIKLLQENQKRFGDKAVKIYDHSSRTYFDLIDSHTMWKEQGFALDMDFETPAHDVEERPSLNEADDREELSHALDIVDVKASTANTIDQDAVAISIVEKELDDKIEEALTEIYK